MDYFKRVAKRSATRFWANNVTREEAELAIGAGAVGCTQNPAFIDRVLKSRADGAYVKAFFDGYLMKKNDDDEAISCLQVELIKNISEYFFPMFEKSGGKNGFVSIQANPFHENRDTIWSNAYSGREAAKNIIIKIPATKEGIAAMRVLVRERVPVLATEVMSMDQLIHLCRMYREETAGLKAPAPFYYAHITGIFDEHMIESARLQGTQIDRDVLWHGSFILARKMVQYVRENGLNLLYMAGGARGLHHFSEMVGVDGSITINWAGTADKLIAADPPVTDHFSAAISYAVVDELIQKMPDFKKAYEPGSLSEDDFEYFEPVVRFRNIFEKGWQSVRDYAVERRKELKC